MYRNTTLFVIPLVIILYFFQEEENKTESLLFKKEKYMNPEVEDWSKSKNPKQIDYYDRLYKHNQSKHNNIPV